MFKVAFVGGEDGQVPADGVSRLVGFLVPCLVATGSLLIFGDEQRFNPRHMLPILPMRGGEPLETALVPYL
jgi:hypothetical protein